jgi:hypothetical protein
MREMVGVLGPRHRKRIGKSVEETRAENARQVAQIRVRSSDLVRNAG